VIVTDWRLAPPFGDTEVIAGMGRMVSLKLDVADEPPTMTEIVPLDRPFGTTKTSVVLVADSTATPPMVTISSDRVVL
jgi:hypothetical protein